MTATEFLEDAVKERKIKKRHKSSRMNLPTTILQQEYFSKVCVHTCTHIYMNTTSKYYVIVVVDSSSGFGF